MEFLRCRSVPTGFLYRIYILPGVSSNTVRSNCRQLRNTCHSDYKLTPTYVLKTPCCCFYNTKYVKRRRECQRLDIEDFVDDTHNVDCDGSSQSEGFAVGT